MMSDIPVISIFIFTFFSTNRWVKTCAGRADYESISVGGAIIAIYSTPPLVATFLCSGILSHTTRVSRIQQFGFLLKISPVADGDVFCDARDTQG